MIQGCKWTPLRFQWQTRPFETLKTRRRNPCAPSGRRSLDISAAGERAQRPPAGCRGILPQIPQTEVVRTLAARRRERRHRILRCRGIPKYLHCHREIHAESCDEEVSTLPTWRLPVDDHAQPAFSVANASSSGLLRDPSAYSVRKSPAIFQSGGGDESAAWSLSIDRSVHSALSLKAPYPGLPRDPSVYSAEESRAISRSRGGYETVSVCSGPSTRPAAGDAGQGGRNRDAPEGPPSPQSGLYVDIRLPKGSARRSLCTAKAAGC